MINQNYDSPVTYLPPRLKWLVFDFSSDDVNFMMDDLSQKLYIRTFVRVIHKFKVCIVPFSLVWFFFGSMKGDIPDKRVFIDKFDLVSRDGISV